MSMLGRPDNLAMPVSTPELLLILLEVGLLRHSLTTKTLTQSSITYRCTSEDDVAMTAVNSVSLFNALRKDDTSIIKFCSVLLNKGKHGYVAQLNDDRWTKRPLE
ncbi:hypothetical protein HUJ04_006988 [Dendroctonus ponderosae]|nr:hypothetical protein HUJ04_006988 [Dendroctonus ponderosae]